MPKSWYSNEPHAEKTNFSFDRIAINRYCLILFVIIMRRHSVYKMFKSSHFFWKFQIILSIRVNNWFFKDYILNGTWIFIQQNNITTIIFLLSPLLLSRPSLSLPLSLFLSQLLGFFVCQYLYWSIASERNLIHPNNRFNFFGKVCNSLQ